MATGQNTGGPQEHNMAQPGVNQFMPGTFGVHVDVHADAIDNADNFEDAEDQPVEPVNPEELIRLLHRERRERAAERADMMAAIDALRVGPGARDRRREDPIRRCIDVSSLEKLNSSVTLREFVLWRGKWDNLSTLKHIAEFPPAEQVAALRMCMTTDMLQTIDMVLNLKAGATTKNILDEIFTHLLKQRSVALDIVEFEECKQAPGEKFDAFYIRLQQVAKCAELCPHCFDRRMTHES